MADPHSPRAETTAPHRASRPGDPSGVAPRAARDWLLGNAHSALAVIDADGIVVEVNDALTQVMARPAERFLGRPLAEVALPGHRDLFAAWVERSQAGNRNPLMVETRIDDDGALGSRLFTGEAQVLTGDSNELLGFILRITESVGALRESELRWRTLVRNVSDTVTVVDAEGQVLASTGEVQPILGYASETWVGRSVIDLLHPDDLARLEPVIEQVLSHPGESVSVETRVRHSDGSWQDLWVNAVNLIEDPAVGGVVMTTRNITHRKRAEALVASHAEILELIARATPLHEILQAVATMVETHVSGAAAAVMVLDGGRLRATTSRNSLIPAEVLAVIDEIPVTAAMQSEVGDVHLSPYVRHTTERETDDPLLGALSASGIETAWWAPVMPPTGDLAIAAVTCFHTERTDPDEHAQQAVDAASRLVTIALDRHNAVSELAHRDLHDSLTGLPNRTLLLDRMQTGLERAIRARSELGVVYVDLDRFKLVNDSYGLVAGDRILTQVADRLRHVTSIDDTIARVGADEFVVLCERMGSLSTVFAVTERITEAMREPFAVDDDEVVLTASLGLALSTAAVDAATLLRQADSAMFRAKQRGRNRLEMYDPVMQASAHDRLALASDLRRALDEGQLRVVYQPIVALETGRIVGAEALCRWDHPQRGNVPPAVFIPVAEETGSMVRIGEWVLATALAELAPLTGLDDDDLGGGFRPSHATPTCPTSGFRLSINLSPRQLDQPDLVDLVAKAVADNGWRPEQVTPELTETAITDDLDLAFHALLGIRATGVRIAVDDFGTGYSSLTHLQRLPIDEVKVDRSFVKGLGEPGSLDRSSIVAAVVGIAEAMGLETVAEGIETAHQLHELKALGCRLGQGHLFSLAVPAQALMELLGVGTGR